MIRTLLPHVCKLALFCLCLHSGFLLAAGAPRILQGELEVVQEDDFAKGTTKQLHLLHEVATGKTYRLQYKANQAKDLLSGTNVVVQGVVLDDQETIRLDDRRNVSVIEPPPEMAATARNAVVMIVDFQDVSVSCAEESVAEIMFTGTSSVDGLYQETSFGTVSFPPDTDGDSAPDVVRVSISARTTDSCDPWGWAAEADAEATNAQIDLGLYQHRVYVLPRDSSCTWAGLANVGCSTFCRVFVKYCNIEDVFAHELGHNLGMHHSSTDPDHDGTIDCEYCDTSDFMGFGGQGWRQVNGPHKYQKGWLPSQQIDEITPGDQQTYVIAPLEVDPSAAGHTQLIRIALPSGDYYYISYRAPIGYDEGLFTDYVNKTSIHASSASGTGRSRLIVALADGETFQDGTISVTQVAHDLDSATLLISDPGSGCSDVDSDGVCGDVDNCPNVANPGQADADGDGFGDACDNCPNDANDDIDGDGVCGDVDNCPDDANADQLDADGDGFGDACEGCPNDPDKTDPGVCGCGFTDEDLDGEGTIDCIQGPASCRYDVTGRYHYDADLGRWVFEGDGGITYDTSRHWNVDDTLACYRTSQNSAYYTYFSQCDFDGDGAVHMDEVLDVYYRVWPDEQPYELAAQACMEGFESTPLYFCRNSGYARAVTDIAAIKAAYPVTAAIEDPATVASRGQQWPQAYDALTCSSAIGTMPPAMFDDLNACSRGTARCLDGASGTPPTCGSVAMEFATAVDVVALLDEYQAVADRYGAVCQAETQPQYDEGPLPGFHFWRNQSNTKWWLWTVRSTAECDAAGCLCDERVQVWTHRDSPGQTWLYGSDQVSAPECSDPRFGN